VHRDLHRWIHDADGDAQLRAWGRGLLAIADGRHALVDDHLQLHGGRRGAHLDQRHRFGHVRLQRPHGARQERAVERHRSRAHGGGGLGARRALVWRGLLASGERAPEQQGFASANEARERDRAHVAHHSAYKGTLKSRSASFRLVFLSVEALRVPMMSAQETMNSPAGNFLGRMPGMTTLRAGTRPRSSFGSLPVTSRMTVEAVSATPAPMTASDSISMPSTMMARLPMKQPSSTMTGCAPGGSSTPPMPTPPDR